MAPDPEHDSKAFPTDLNDLGGWVGHLPNGFTIAAPKSSAPSGSNTTNNNNDQGDAS